MTKPSGSATVADRPIIFSAPMIRALLEGRKSQTRRVLKPQPAGVNIVGVKWPDGVLDCNGRRLRFAPGDRLWVKESWAMPNAFDTDSPTAAAACVEHGRTPNVFYLADGSIRAAGSYTGRQGKSRVSIHMPRWASRLTLLVTDVRVQRLQEISEEDARAEGLEWIAPTYGVGGIAASWNSNPRQSYAALWDSLHGASAWEANPWVVAVTFDVRKGNIDQQEGR